ncbi:Murein DD-endopeptidase MepM and murein hydrolase activator NlpD, contain LysM domain [Microlunatus flavus]|uniref:Murein DD-endopeptidase MepM and murein hydrolase activator NlpD, contain LysM domain n=1 Tax=Microlunatus flavus TaxID=1036181 RepID=A0A1H9GUM8_9ACTN|nr:Murein DD-endopeptidase MepM and murein hydrolase activator NlpD, contain LysM domain [Microlunatus flavus]
MLLALLLVGPARPAAAAPDGADDPGSGVDPTTGGWPLDGTPTVLEGFDPPDEAWGPGHRGVDLEARPGQQVLAPADGTVVFVGRVGGKPVVVVDHGGVRSTLEPVGASVRVGQRVRRGDVVGRVGREEHCEDRCLHWGLKRGATYLDPLLPAGRDGSAGTAGTLRLVPSSRRALVVAEALAREAARRAAETAAVGFVGGSPAAARPLGPPGSHGFVHPVPGAVTSPFGRRFHPVLHVWKLHDGTDFGAACGTPIRAAYDGRVTRRVASTGYGNRLFVDHGRVDGHAVVTAYNHATRYVVSPGDRVRRGQVVGYVGRTGFATGCHLHLMVWLDGRMVDPGTWL